MPKRAEARSGDSRGSTRNETRRVLVVDDERSIRMLCRVNLRASGMDVLEADDGETGLELARRERPDLILLDVMMPGLDGWGVARELAADKNTQDIPIIFITARADPADRRLGEQLGGVGYIVKPFDPVGIGELVDDVLTRLERGEREQLQRGISTEHEAVSIHEREDRALRLQRVAELLAEAVTPQEVLDAILTEGVRAAEARAGAIGVLSDDGESVELLAQQGYAGAIMEDWARISRLRAGADVAGDADRRAALHLDPDASATSSSQSWRNGARTAARSPCSRSRSRVASSARWLSRSRTRSSSASNGAR